MSVAGTWTSASTTAALGVIAVCLTGCTNESPSLRVISVTPPANMTISFSADVQPIFTRSCAKGGCHAGTATAQGLNLEAGKSYVNLVRVPSTEVSLNRVEPGRIDLSYLINKLEGTGIGDQMPQGGPFLPDAEVQVIKDWIAQGALDN
jgi:hypothetical protein